MPLLLNEDELRQTIIIGEAIESVKMAFAALAQGRMHIPGDFAMDLPQVKGEVHVKGTYLIDTPYYVVKVGSNFQDNPKINLPVTGGLTAVFDAATGFPAAILFDNGYISHIRAGAAGALAAQYLANQELSHVAVIGAGNQAYIQLKTLMTVRSFNSVSVWSRSPATADNYARAMVEDHNVNIEIAPSVEAAVRQADLIITATPSTEPLLKAEWLKPGVHITAIGSNSPPKQELDIDVVQRADVIICDRLSRCTKYGELHHALETGAISQEEIQGELGQLIIDNIPGRTHPDQITLADLVGLEVQDAAIATLALEKALFLGLGQRVMSRLR